MIASSKLPHERRRHPRIAKNVPLKICQEDGDIITETVNLSRSGAYCCVEKYIQPMTKMKAHLLLPLKRNGKTVNKKISCSGVVIRSEPVAGSNLFSLAIFFNDITQKDADIIAGYIGSILEDEV
jgi:hypothetical protein